MTRHFLLGLTLFVLSICCVLFGGVEIRVINPCIIALTAIATVALLPVVAGRSALPRDPVLLSWALIVGGALFSLTYSAHRHATLDTVIRLVGYALIYALIRHLPVSRRAVRGAIGALLLLTLAMTLYGLWSTLLHKGALLWVTKSAYVDSVTGTFINRSHFAAFLGLHLMVGLALFVTVDGPRRVLLGLALAVAMLAQALTLSRGGLAATVVGMVTLVGLLRPSQRSRLLPLLMAAGIAAVALAYTNGAGLQRRLEALVDPQAEFSSAARISMWKSTIRAGLDAPLLGYGAGTFESVYPRYREPGINRLVTYAHQDYLELFTEQGILGVVLTLAAAMVASLTLFRARRDSGADHPLVAGVIAGLVLVAAAAMVDFPLKIPAVAMAASAWLAVALALTSHGPATKLSASASRWVAVAALGLLCLCATRATQSMLGDRQIRRAEAAFEPPWTTASAAYRRATEIDSLDPRGFAGLAHCEMNRLKFQLRESREHRQELADTALQHLTIAERLDPMKGDYNLQRAWLFNFLGRFPEAAKEYELAIADDPANANSLFHAGVFYLHRKELDGHDRGVELLRKAVHTFPGLFGGKIHEIHYLLPEVNTIVSLVPEDQPFLLFQLATYLLEQARDQGKAAKEVYQQAVRLADWPQGWVLGFTGSVAQRESREAALELAMTVPSERRTPEVEYHIARLHMGLGRDQEALDTLLRASEQHPESRDLLRYVVRFAGDTPAAHTALDRYRTVVGEDAGYHIAAGYLALARGDKTAAATRFASALAKEPDDLEAKAAAGSIEPQ